MDRLFWRADLGSLAGGFLIFFWGAIAHMVTPLGTMGLSRLPPGAEAAILATVKEGFARMGSISFPVE